MSADIKMLQILYTDALWLVQTPSILCITVASAKRLLKTDLSRVLTNGEQSRKSVSKQIAAVADSLSLHILLSVKKREGSGRVRWGELSESDRAGPLQESQS